MISVKDEELDDLTERLEKARWPDQLELAPDAKWSYGTGTSRPRLETWSSCSTRLTRSLFRSSAPRTDLDFMKQLTKYWANDYLDNWKMHEKRLNQFPHYKIEVRQSFVAEWHAL